MTARLVATALLVLALAACGGSSGKKSSGAETPSTGTTTSASNTKTFDEKGFAITFEYPDNFKVSNDLTVSSTAGAAAADRTAVALDGKNMILIERYDLNISVDESNLDKVKAEADRVMSQVAGTTVSGKKLDAGSLPGFEYVIELSKPENGQSRIAMVFTGKQQYNLNCQSTPDKRTEVDGACSHAVSTLSAK